MFKELVTKYLKKLNLISVYRIVIFTFIATYFHNIYIALLLLFLIILFNKNDVFIYILLILLILVSNSIHVDFIPIGIVERKTKNYYVVDKLIYKTNLYSDDVKIGDIIYSYDYNYVDDISFLKNNIKYNNTKFKVISNLLIRKKIYNLINENNSSIRTILNKLIYNINDYTDQNYIFGYGLVIYYLIKSISKRNKYIGFLLIVIYSLFFYFDIKFYLIIIDIIFSKKEYRLPIKILFIEILNIYLLRNYSIIIPIIFSLYSCINININFKTYILFIDSLLFGYVNIIYLLFYRLILYLEILELLISFFSLYINELSSLSIFLANIITFINSIDLTIRGKASLLIIFIYLFFSRYLKNNSLFAFILSCLLIISPLNNPIFHISYIDIGQGDSILIKLPFNTCNILIDTGSKYNYYKLKKYLYDQGIYNIDYLIITHNDSDHNGCIEELKNNFYVNKIITKGEDINYNDFCLKYLYIGDFDNDNDNSLVYWMNINNFGFLFTGDISSMAEKMYIKKYKYLNVDFLKVSHHGSSSSSSKYFIGNTLPRYAIISTSGQYNHPSKETINNFNQYMVDYHITKNEGDIELYLLPWFSIFKNDNLEFVIIK